ncbi:hypothetical protein MNBD_CHLOROFLEXI01-1521, partial [hydrothermal vent metagenome]
MNTRKLIILMLITAVFILGSYLYTNIPRLIAKAEPAPVTISID